MIAVAGLDDARVAALARGIEAPVLERGDHFTLVDVGVQAAVAGAAGVGGVGDGQRGEGVLGLLAVVVLLQELVGLLLTVNKNVTHGHRMIVVAAAGVEEHGIVAALTIGGDGGVSLLTGIVKRPGQHIGSAVFSIADVRVGAFHILADGVERLTLRIAGESGLGLLLGLLEKLGLFFVRCVVAGSGGEENVLNVGALIALGISVVSGLHLVGGVGQGVDIAAGIGLCQRHHADVALEDLLVDQRAADGLDVLRAGVTGGSGGSVQIGKRILHGLLHGLAAVKALGLRLLRKQGVGGHAGDGLIAEIVVPGAVVDGAALLLERLGGVQTISAQIIGVLGDKAAVDGIVEVAHVGGRVGLVADGERVGLALDHLGIGDRNNDADDHKDDGDGDVKGVGTAILRLLVLFTLCPGIDVTACQTFLAALLFSGCTHFVCSVLSIIGFCRFAKCY